MSRIKFTFRKVRGWRGMELVLKFHEFSEIGRNEACIINQQKHFALKFCPDFKD